MRNYTPHNWHWIVAGDETRVYSSATGDYVPVFDEAYQAWLASGNAPTHIASEDELAEVLAPYQIRPANGAVLDKYKGVHARGMTKSALEKLLFRIVNEILELKGQDPITPQQFRNYVKGLL